LTIGKVLPTPRVWGLAHPAPEELRQVRLICKAAPERYVAERILRCQHQLLCPFQPEPNDVHVRRGPEAVFESTAEMTGAQGNLLGQLLDLQRALQVLSKVAIHLSFLP
jgi:hypothetical protein